MNKPKVSILVPICNVEKFLDKCLQSLINQSLDNMEIICINDGSKDNSSSIIKKYADQDRRIVVIEKVNTGYGDSMNKGLKVAKGEYIGIVESDDFAEAEMFEELYELAKKNNADLVKSNFNLYWEKPEKKVFMNNLNITGIVYDSEIGKESVFWGLPAIWSAIYKKEWLEENNINFLPTPGASYQDTSFNFKVACSAKKIVLTNKAYLNYRQDNVNSSVKNASLEKVYLLHKEWEEAERYMNEKNLIVCKKYYNTLKLNGFMWNYTRLSAKDRIQYYKELYSCYKYGLPINKCCLRKVLRYGGLYALRTDRKWLLDLILAIRNTIKHEK